MDSVVTAVTAVNQWSMVKAAQKGVVNGQSRSKGCSHQEIRSLLSTAGYGVEWMASYARTAVCSLSLERFSYRAASFREVPHTIDGQNC